MPVATMEPPSPPQRQPSFESPIKNTNHSQLLSSPQRKSRFQFHSDTKAPSELKEIEQQTHKRHTDFRRRVNDLDRKIAGWTSRFANEVMQRDRESSIFLDDAVFDPLEQCAERFMRRLDAEFGQMQGPVALHAQFADDSSEDSDSCTDSEDNDVMDRNVIDVSETATTETNTGTGIGTHLDRPFKSHNLQSLSQEISNLSSEMTQYIHITLPSIQDEHIGSFHRMMRSEIPPKLHIEKTKAVKREQAMFQKFESISGLAGRSQAEANACRVATLKLLEEKVLEAGGWDELRTSRFMDEIKDIRRMLQEEKEARVENDKAVLDQIVTARVSLHRTLLQTAGSGDSDDYANDEL